MRAVADTHAVFWWFSGDPALSARARAAMADTRNAIFVSAVSAWEMAIKTRLGKMDAERLLDAFQEQLEEQGFTPLFITVEHALRAGGLPDHHHDPFDRMLVAQAQAEKLAIISADRIFERYGVRRIW
jgi:PIN domain nuclease of toxin-antitoxin system